MRELHCVFNRGVCGKQRSAICRIDIVPLIISHIWLILVIFFSAMNNKVFMHQSFYISRKKMYSVHFFSFSSLYVMHM